jgi:iron complex outermembrane receptor protein
MEYLRHKVVLQAESRLFSRLNVAATWRWQDRVGAGNAPYALLDARLSWDAPRWSVYADCSNLLDKTYYDYSIVRQPGRWAKVGMTWKFGL